MLHFNVTNHVTCSASVLSWRMYFFLSDCIRKTCILGLKQLWWGDHGINPIPKKGSLCKHTPYQNATWQDRKLKHIIRLETKREKTFWARLKSKQNRFWGNCQIYEGAATCAPQSRAHFHWQAQSCIRHSTEVTALPSWRSPWTQYAPETWVISAGFAGGGGRDGDILQISRSPSFTFFTKTRFSIREVPCCSLNPSSCPLLTGWLASTNSFPTMAFSCSAWEYQARTRSKLAILEEESLVIALLPTMLRATRCRRGNGSFSFLSWHGIQPDWRKRQYHLPYPMVPATRTAHAPKENVSDTHLGSLRASLRIRTPASNETVPLNHPHTNTFIPPLSILQPHV